MGNAARKARKRANVKFERQPKTPTHRYRTKAMRQTEDRAMREAYEKLRQSTNATPAAQWVAEREKTTPTHPLV